MKTIWKYQLKISEDQRIEMPAGAKILSVQAQNKVPCLWALVDPEAEKEKRFFEVFGTGNPIKEYEVTSRKFIDTFQAYCGSLVFHVFEYTVD